ncbi:hypothetical protein MSG28_006618 [Choristoneura fumiferana]|uniref:Uncharacterized protein n=1 Tax=Choristoneura fumiferana TaxID=7141 RepID=A0ACC0JFJ6_CHOFU|nr:hypothetical protein MSG28_006618 [Choristoneura fumiferana]
MDTLLVLKRPIKIVVPNKKNKLTKSRARKLWPSPLGKVAKKPEEGLSRMNKASCETILENASGTEPERVSFVSLYNELCRKYFDGGSDSELAHCNVATILSAGDHARRARAHVVMEIDY